MPEWTDFFLLQDPNVRWVVTAVVLMTLSASVAGCFTFLQKKALLGDAISHAILPGVCLAFMLWQGKNPLVLLIGAVFSGWLGILSIDFIVAYSKIKADTALGLVLSVFYGLGIFLLTMIQESGNASQSGLNSFLFGRAAAMVYDDVVVFAVFSIILLSVIVLLFNPLKLLIFDRDFAKIIGYPVEKLELLLSFLTVLAIAIGIQAVGVVLMSALLVTPAASARYWSNRLLPMMLLSGGFALLSGILGTYVSYTLPQMPTGPWIVVFLTFFAFCSVLFGSKKGVVARKILHRKNKTKILTENILKALYHLGEKEQVFGASYSLRQIQSKRFIAENALKRGIKKLKKQALLREDSDKTVRFSPQGLHEGRRITRIHRLWEIYLTQHLHLPADHVHHDAEAIEHIITPEIEAQLLQELKNPKTDPHQSPIPYDKK